jgi:spore germination protein PE
LFKRTSLVEHISIIDVTSGSIFEIGDSYHIQPRSKALAVQREYELFYGDEGDLKTYPIFTNPIPKPTVEKPICFKRYNESPYIKVNHINLFGCAASGVCHIGSTKTIDAETRIKHIRQMGEPAPNDDRNVSVFSE